MNALARRRGTISISTARKVLKAAQRGQRSRRSKDLGRLQLHEQTESGEWNAVRRRSDLEQEQDLEEARYREGWDERQGGSANRMQKPQSARERLGRMLGLAPEGVALASGVEWRIGGARKGNSSMDPGVQARPSFLLINSTNAACYASYRLSKCHTDSGWNPFQTERDDPAHEAATAKLWAVYVSEAEKYDKGLVESWKCDMEGILIFAGLFSAILTALLTESYKTMKPDSGDITVFFLAQISQQLAASANITTFDIALPAPFTPLMSSLSGLSLTCALVATLLEQWGRDFLHRADMRSAPATRARVFSYLYHGLKRFKMHTVVEIIPLLLHMSLFFFFAGFIAFLIPVNIVITAVVGSILVMVTGVYTLLTTLPLFHLDCPYRTPLSGCFWRFRQILHTMLHRWDADSSESATGENIETMVEGVFRKATENSVHRSDRDQQALLWTAKSLTDDVELEPFIESIPDVLWGNDKRRYIHDEHTRGLIEDPNIQLVHRIQSLQKSCDSGLLTLEVTKRRLILCYTANGQSRCQQLGSACIPCVMTGWYQASYQLDIGRWSKWVDGPSFPGDQPTNQPKLHSTYTLGFRRGRSGRDACLVGGSSCWRWSTTPWVARSVGSRSRVTALTEGGGGEHAGGKDHDDSGFAHHMKLYECE
ncbi:hypothetical protein B0H13DRAFT_2418723 [Mycena leptocephala]|nr:hypothetical protein B0H13DRAFT_2418723 [Mycena leptocephala]